VRIRIVAALAGLLISVFALPAIHAQAQGTDTRIRFAHFSVDASGVDIYIDGKKKMQRVPYQAVTDYVTVPAGKHTIEARGEGAPETDPAVFTVSPQLAAAKSFTVAALGPVANIQAKVFEDDLAAPTAGKSKIRVIHGADGVKAVDVAVKDGAVLFPALDYGAISTYVEVPAGSYTLQVRNAGAADALFEKAVSVNAGGIYTIAALGGGDKPLSVRGYIDVAKANTPPPAGGVTSAPTGTEAAGTPTSAAAGTEAAPSPATTAKPQVSATEAATAAPTKAPKATKAPSTEVPIVTKAPPPTVAAPVGGGDTPAPTTKKATTTPSGTKPPTGKGPSTGFGGFDGPSGALSLAAIAALLLGSIGTGVVRRRSIGR
jgi:Domain of unknown function (DUF4397)